MISSEKINMTTIHVDSERKWSDKGLRLTKRQVLPTLVFVLFVITLITTALSMAKYATSNSSEQLASVNSTKFIWSSDLVSTGTTSGATITGDSLSKESLTLSDAYVPFSVKNFETASGVKNVNGETISFKISVTGNLKIEDITNPLVPKDGTTGTYQMSQGVEKTFDFKVEPNGVAPGTYTGTVTVESTSPYVKKYVRQISIVLKDTEVTYREDSTQLFVNIQNGIKDNVTVIFTFQSPIYYMNVNVPAEVGVVYDSLSSPRTVTMTFPAGAKAQIQFRSTNGVPTSSDVTYLVN